MTMQALIRDFFEGVRTRSSTGVVVISVAAEMTSMEIQKPGSGVDHEISGRGGAAEKDLALVDLATANASLMVHLHVP